ncbi:MAG TPA: hypothetical protein VIW19_13805 [Gaiellaceae bacterium]
MGIAALLCTTAALGNSRQVGSSGTIRWVLDHEPRGQSLRAAHISVDALVGSHWQPVRFARVLRPDPRTNVRIAVSLVGKHGRNMCMTAFLGRVHFGGCGVGSGLRPISPMMLGDHVVVGLARDGVSRVTLIDSNGRRHHAALRDNALSVAIRGARALKLLAYDRQHRLVGTTVLR